jgi:hypothetical protein
MKFNKWTLGLAAVGVVGLASAARADEAKMSMVQTALSSTTLSGYVDTAAIWRPGTDSGPLNTAGNIPAYSFAKNDGFFLNAVDLVLDKPEDENPWASGYHVELMFGPDAVGGAFGGPAASTNLREAYVRLRTPIGNGIDWQIGVFGNIIGYESTSDILDPNYTRSYAWTIEPTTHTGILGTYKVNDALTVQAGVADSSNVGAASPAPVNGTPVYESQKAYLGMITLTAPDSWGWAKGGTLSLAVENAVDSSVAPGTGTKTSWYAGVTIPTPNAALKFGGSFDLLNLNNSGTGNPSDDSVWVVALYSTYRFSDKVSLNLRGEYVDNQGTSAASSPFVANPAYAGHEAEEITATIQYNIWANVISRVEFRWDHVDANAFGYSSSGGPMKKSDFMLAFNIAYMF